jgi:hypothetical protein
MKNKLGNNPLFDPKMGLVGALVLAAIVFAINYEEGVSLASIAAAKQGLYTFFAGGFMMRLVENLSIKWDEKIVSYAISVLVATAIAVSLTYGLHSLKGTPKPLLSTIPTIILGPPGFFWWAYKKRNQLS